MKLKRKKKRETNLNVSEVIELNIGEAKSMNLEHEN